MTCECSVGGARCHQRACAGTGLLTPVGRLSTRVGRLVPPEPAALRATRSIRSRGPDRRRHGGGGFSLIEMLIVLGLIVFLVGAFALALRGRSTEGVALANSQTILTGLVGATRAQAALHQTNARLIIYAQMPPSGDATKYLRALQVVRADTPASGTGTIWTAVGDPVMLPAPICIVPTAPVPTSHLNTGVTWNNNVAMGPVSVLAVQNAFSYRGQGAGGAANQFFGTTGNGRIFHLEFDATGAVTNPATSPIKIALTTAVLAGNALPRFNNANAVRGLVIRRSGAVSFVDEANGF